MACSVPIVASAIAPLSEIAAGAAWFFNPQDKYDMAEKMAEVLLDKKLANGLINSGTSRIKDFSLAKCAKETLALMEAM
jgi:glycosyltransferase involved in cell wall biosynthesis